MILRIRFAKQGGHVHCRVFTAPGPDRTFAKCGDLVFDEREWPLVQKSFQNVGPGTLDDHDVVVRLEETSI